MRPHRRHRTGSGEENAPIVTTMGRQQGQRAASHHAPDDSEPTAERVTVEEYMTSEADYVIYCLHVSTYAFAARYTSGTRVLDLGLPQPLSDTN